MGFTPAMVITFPVAIGIACLIASVVCWIACMWCWLAALSTKPDRVSWMDGRLWFKMPPEGKRLRNWGFVFFVCVAVFGLIGGRQLGMQAKP